MNSCKNGITSFNIQNLGKLQKICCDSLSGINLIIGKNGTGKTFLLKALYSAIKTVEEYNMGDGIRDINKMLTEKLHWTFQVEKLGELVSRCGKESFEFSMSWDNNFIDYQFDKNANSKIVTLTNLEK